MSNKVYINNNLARLKNKELIAALEQEGDERMLWRFKKNRPKKKKEKIKNEDEEVKEK